MIRFLIQRPIAVSMAFLAFFILGIVTYLNISVSLLPNIAIPEITVQVEGQAMSAHELESKVVQPVRRQLMQVGNVRDLQSQTRNGSAMIKLLFDYGTNVDLAFIEVNEKIDGVMNSIPKDISRPKVVKANATDIPVFYLNLTLKDDKPYEQSQEQEFIALSEFSESVVRRRVEQLEEVAMVDMSGLVNQQLSISPKQDMLSITGISLTDIENVLKNNNIEPGSMVVNDGHYQYNIIFSTIVRTLEDVQNLYIKKNGRILQLKELADVSLVPQEEEGLLLYNGKRAVSLAIIKQADENMADMQKSLNKTISHLAEQYPNITFSSSQDQTELLDFTISNLQVNLILAFIFICFVSSLFMQDLRSPIVIGISMMVSLVVSLLFFYLFHVSLNIISLTGLVLALGMMIDNAIIVTDNIGQYRRKGFSIDDACVQGTNEVIAPMLSSSFTTISVFIPLVFISGIAGAIFFDQAFSVTVGLLVSYVTGIILLPVMYKLIYQVKTPRFLKFKKKKETKNKTPIGVRIYDRISDWVFAHKRLVILLVLATLPICAWIFVSIDKEKMPAISQNEMLVQIDWNENIHLEENKERIVDLLKYVEAQSLEQIAYIGRQQFILNREQAQDVSETELYIRIEDADKLQPTENDIAKYIEDKYPIAELSFSPTTSIFEQIFTTGEPDLRAKFVSTNVNKEISQATVEKIRSELKMLVGQNPTTLSFEEQLDLHINKEKLLLYGVDYDDIYKTLESGLKESEVTTLRSYQRYIPIKITSSNADVNAAIHNSLIKLSNEKENTISWLPLSEFVSIYTSEGTKTIVSDRNGSFVPFDFFKLDNEQAAIDAIRTQYTGNTNWDVGFAGAYFSNQKMINELMVILIIAVLLMYFILAAQFESFSQPLIVLLEIPIDIAAVLIVLYFTGQSLNLMSAIGIVVTCGIIINDSILKIDIINQLRKQGVGLIDAIHQAGHRRLNAILLTSLTTIVCMLPILFNSDMGSELEKPLAIALVAGMSIGTPVSLFIVPLVYWFMHRGKEKNKTSN